MTPERWAVVKAVFAAIDEEPSRRTGILAERCGDDAELRREVEQLLDAAVEGDTSPGRRVVAAAAANMILADGRNMVGRHVGPYRITREMGSGGMGTVYEAVRAEGFEKRVAVKVIRSGFPTADALRRFSNERQILANLEHANIARLLDGGTTADGVPYLVMELVEGVPVDRYCDERGLDLHARLRLFLDVCAAVQYAHQHLVVHRDLKPTNVLVTDDGVPKLVDFGISKIMEPDTGAETITEFRAMTPEFASPEQVSGKPITTSSDVYSLGVVLFRMLTGTGPYDTGSGSAHDVARAILEIEPRRPSERVTDRRLARQLRGDLDNIVLMSLRKDVQRRYASVQQFAQDVERFLRGHTVSARPDTFGYRFTRFVTRYPVASSVVTVLSAGIIGASLFAVQQAIEARDSAQRARVAQAKAERRFADVRKLARALVFDFDQELSSLAGSTRARELVVTNALSYLDSLSREADDPALRNELATAYARVGEIQGNPYASNLNKLPEAKKSYEKAVAIAAGVVKSNPRNAAFVATLAAAHAGLADIEYQQGSLKEAAAEYRRALAIWGPVQSTRGDALRSVALTHAKLGDLLGNPGYSNLGDHAGAAEQYRQSMAIREGLYAKHPQDDSIARELSEICTKAGYFHASRGETGEAVRLYDKSVGLLERIVQSQPNSAAYLSDLSLALMTSALTVRDSGDAVKAMQRLDRARTIMTRLIALDGTSKLWPRNLSVIDNHLSATAVEARDYAAAQKASAEAVRLAETLLREDASNLDVKLDVAIALRRQSDARFGAGDYAGARQSAQRALSFASQLPAENSSGRFEVAVDRSRVGRAAAAQDLRSDAREHLARAVRELRDLSRENPGNIRHAEELATALLTLGSVERQEGAPAQSCASLAQAAELLHTIESGGKARAHVKQLSVSVADAMQGCR